MHEKTLLPVTKSRLPHIDRSLEMAWIAKHRNQYAGQWVALDGDRLIASGDDPMKFKDKVKMEGVSRPFIVHITKEPDAEMEGWL